MYSLFCGLCTWLFAREELRLLLLGLDNAGKTTALEQLKRHFHLNSLPLHKIVPTVGFNMASLQICSTGGGGRKGGAVGGAGEVNAILWDLGGGDGVRSIWDSYYQEADGVLFVVDASDPDRLPQAARCLHETVGHAKMQGGRRMHPTPVLIIANKQDKEGAMTVDEIVSGLELHSLGTRGGGGRGMTGGMPLQQQRRISSSGVVGSFNNSSSSLSSSSPWCAASEQVVNVCPCSCLNDQGLSEALHYLVQAVLLLRRKPLAGADASGGTGGEIGSPFFRARSIITHHSRDGQDRHFTVQGKPLTGCGNEREHGSELGGGGGSGVGQSSTAGKGPHEYENDSSNYRMSSTSPSVSPTVSTNRNAARFPSIASLARTPTASTGRRSGIVGSTGGVVGTTGGMKLSGGRGGPLGHEHVLGTQTGTNILGTPTGTNMLGTPTATTTPHLHHHVTRFPFDTSITPVSGVIVGQKPFSLPEELFESPSVSKAIFTDVGRRAEEEESRRTGVDAEGKEMNGVIGGGNVRVGRGGDGRKDSSYVEGVGLF
eukprot:GHVS01004052.1.p1 GENE.GHVS01004052.1~~GHVS01004052.1.p1  ORF type:complete len:543 (-),score=117.65 GHVS01004052.1:768-2396(-)